MYLQHVCINTGMVVLKHFLRNGQASRCFITAVGVRRPGHEPVLTVTRPMISATIALSCGVFRDYHSKNSRSLISQTEGLKVAQYIMTGHISAIEPHRSLTESESIACVNLGEAVEKQANGRGDVSSHVGDRNSLVGIAYLCGSQAPDCNGQIKIPALFIPSQL